MYSPRLDEGPDAQRIDRKQAVGSVAFMMLAVIASHNEDAAERNERHVGRQELEEQL